MHVNIQSVFCPSFTAPPVRSVANFMDTGMSRNPRTFARAAVLTRVNESEMVLF